MYTDEVTWSMSFKLQAARNMTTFVSSARCRPEHEVVDRCNLERWAVEDDHEQAKHSVQIAASAKVCVWHKTMPRRTIRTYLRECNAPPKSVTSWTQQNK